MSNAPLHPDQMVLREMLIERRSSKELRRFQCQSREVPHLLKSTVGRNDQLLGWLVTPQG